MLNGRLEKFLEIERKFIQKNTNAKPIKRRCAFKLLFSFSHVTVDISHVLSPD